MSTSALLCGTAGSVCCDLCVCTAVVCRHALYSVVRQVSGPVSVGTLHSYMEREATEEHFLVHAF